MGNTHAAILKRIQVQVIGMSLLVLQFLSHPPARSLTAEDRKQLPAIADALARAKD